MEPTTGHVIQSCAYQEGDKEYDGTGGNDAVNPTKQDLHGGGIPEEALACGPLDFGAGFDEEAKLGRGGKPGEEAIEVSGSSQ